MSDAHGYGPYTHGCRCDICRRAKADYMRERRALARAVARRYTTQAPRIVPGAFRHLAPIAKHGTRYGYEEAGCRCLDCTAARNASDAKRVAARRTGAS